MEESVVDPVEQLRAAQATIAHLETALASNRRVGLALGILMATHGLTEEQALRALMTYGQITNRVMREVAEDVVTQGQLPDLPADAGRLPAVGIDGSLQVVTAAQRRSQRPVRAPGVQQARPT